MSPPQAGKRTLEENIGMLIGTFRMAMAEFTMIPFMVLA